MTPRPAIDLLEVLWSARRRVWVALLPLTIVICAALVWIALETPLYQSRVTVAMRDQPTVSEALEPLVRNPAGRRETYAVVVAKLDNAIHSRPFLEAIARRTGLAGRSDLLEEGRAVALRSQGITAEEYALRRTVGMIQDKISVERLGPPYVRITAVDQVPANAQALAAAVGDGLIEESKRAVRQRTSARREFSTEQVNLYEQKLRESEEALRGFQESLIARRSARSPVTSVNAEGAQLALQFVEDEIAHLRAEVQSDSIEWSGYDRGDAPVLSGHRATELETALGDLEVGYAQASLRAASSPDDGAAFKVRIADTRERLSAEYERLSAGLDGNRPDAARQLLAGMAFRQSVLRSLERKQERLNILIAGHVQVLQSSPGEELELERLRSEVQMNRDLLLALRKEASSSQISQAMEASDFSLSIEVIEFAQIPLVPFSPDTTKVMGGALLLGLLLSAGTVIAVGRFGASVSTIHEAEHETGVEVIGTFPRVDGWSSPDSFLVRHWPALSILLILLATGLLLTVHSRMATDHVSTTSHIGMTK